MDSTILNVVIYSIIGLFVVGMAYGLYGYARQVFNANRR